MGNGNTHSYYNNFEEYFTGRFEDIDLFSKMMLSDAKTYLPDFILTKVDRCSMSVSLEAREPFLDHRLMEYIARLPVNVKVKNGTTKVLARKILKKYIPDEYINIRKQGFGIPVNKWLRSDNFKELVAEHLNGERIRSDGIFNEEIVERYKDEFYNYNLFHGQRIWNLLIFQMWKEKWL